jgi:hypothetical protein
MYLVRFHFDLVDDKILILVEFVQILKLLVDKNEGKEVVRFDQFAQQYVSIVLFDYECLKNLFRKIIKPVFCKPGISLNCTSARVVSGIISSKD